MKNSIIQLFSYSVIAFISITSANAQFSGGDGSSGNPYIISTSAQLAQLATFVNAGNTTYNNKHYKLQNDIDLSEYGEGSAFNNGKGWIPIGKRYSTSPGEYYQFYGNFDGDNNKITGLYLNDATLMWAGLFGRLQGGTVQNLAVEDANISGSGFVGAIAAYPDNESKVTNCYSSGTMTTSDSGIGGIAGWVDNGSDVIDCYSSCTVISTGSLSLYIGGVVGLIQSYSSITGCYFTGEVISSYALAGGVIGSAGYYSKVSNCYSTGNVKGNFAIGGVVGQVQNWTPIVNCYATGNIEGNSDVGGVVGTIYNTSYVSDCYSSATVTGLGRIGGIVGYQYFNEQYDGDQVTIENCYSFGAIRGTQNNTGGIAGNIDKCYMANCAALNPSVNGTGNNTGRVVGGITNKTTLENNIAFDGISGNNWNNIGADKKDGENISVEDINADGTLGNRFTTEGGWTTANRMLPGFGEPVEMPEHLRLQGGDPPIIITENLPDGNVGTEYFQTLIAEGDTPITWLLESGNLPDGLELSNDGIISGKPTTDGTFDFTVKASNAVGNDTKEFAIIIKSLNISENNQTQTLKVYVQNGSMYISGLTVGETVKIYSILGILVYDNIASGEEITVTLRGSNGIYIVKSGNKTAKIVFE